MLQHLERLIPVYFLSVSHPINSHILRRQTSLVYGFRLALIMQNEEFLRELKRNEDFMRTLEFERGNVFVNIDMSSGRLSAKSLGCTRLVLGT